MKTTKNILIIDDDTDMCWVLSEVLKEEGYSANIVHEKKSALTIITKKNFDLIILDYKLGNDDGLSILKEINSKKQGSKIIMISAYGNKKLKDEAEKDGVIDFIDKPFDIAKFVTKIKNIIE